MEFLCQLTLDKCFLICRGTLDESCAILLACKLNKRLQLQDVSAVLPVNVVPRLCQIAGQKMSRAILQSTITHLSSVCKIGCAFQSSEAQLPSNAWIWVCLNQHRTNFGGTILRLLRLLTLHKILWKYDYLELLH